MRKKRILTVLLVSMALAALLAGCAEEEIGPAAPLVPAQTDEQPPASEPDESTVPEEPESEEEPEAQPDVGALLEAYLQTGGDAEKETLFTHPEEAAAEAMRRLLARPKEERDALCSDECEAAVLFRLVEELVQDDVILLSAGDQICADAEVLQGSVQVNEALLTGLLFCSCGERMYPKMSKRKTADGKVIYTYVCKMKERSQRTVCNSKNANGNTLDMAIIEQVKMLADDKETFVSQLEQSRKFYTGNRMDYEQRLDDMRKEKAETEKKINSLVDSLVDMGDSPAKAHVTKRIEQLNEEYQSLEKRIQELEGLTTQHALSDVEFDLMRQLLTVFKDGIDEMTIEQKRAAIRTIVRKVIWDGVNAHVVLFGVQDDEIEYPEIASAASDNTDDEDDNDKLVAFSDVDYEDDDTEDDRLGKTNPLSASKTHWGEDSK